MNTVRFPFQGLFGKIAAAFRHKNRRPIEHQRPQPPEPVVLPKLIEQLFEPRWGFAAWLLNSNDNPRNLSPGGKELMLQLAEEKRERRRARNRRLAGIA
jgi:hypothetical protein